MREISYLEAAKEAIREEMERDKNVFVIGLDVVSGITFGVTTGLSDIFGVERIIDTPISESSVVGAGVGAAMTGLRPIVEIMISDILTLCMEQIVNQAAKLRFMTGGQISVPMVIRTPGGHWGAFAAQHSQSLEAWFMHIPGLKVVAPSNPYDLKGLLKTAIRDNNPVIFFEHKKLYPMKGHVPENDYTISFGKAEIKKEGRDITIVTYSWMVTEALLAADILEKEGISAEVVDLRTLLPLDEDTILESLRKTGKVIIAEEDCMTGGVGAEIAAILADKGFEYLDAPIRRIAARMSPIPFNPKLEQYIIPGKNNIVSEIRALLNE